MVAAPVQPTLFCEPMAALMPIPLREANALLDRWEHRLGPVHRPFRSEAFALMVDQRPVAVAVSASIVGGPVAGYQLTEVVELARLCAEPGNRWANRVLLRLWREIAAPRWKCWPVRAAVSYSHNAFHRGEILRADGWKKVNDNSGSRGGRSFGRESSRADVSYGRKSLWLWVYESEVVR